MLHVLPPEYKPDTPPFAHQRESLSLGWKRDGFAYLLEMGLGKSRVLIDDFCLNYEIGNVDGLLVIAPKSVYSNWSRVDDENPGELQKWMWKSVADGAVTYQYKAGKWKKDVANKTAVMDRTAPGPRIMVMNIEALSMTAEAVDAAIQFLKRHKCMMVIDESTVIKDPKSKRTKMMLKLRDYAKMRRILTGSPSTGSLSDVWAQFEFLQSGCLGYKYFTSFQYHFCELREMHIGNRTIKSEVGPKNIEELRELLKGHSIRKRKSECLDLPEKVYERVEVELTEEQERAYKEMKSSAMTVVRGQEVTTQIVVTQLMRLHQIVCGHVTADDKRVLHLKTRRLEALVDVIRRSGEKSAIIWCCYRPEVALIMETLQKEFGEGCAVEWTGGVDNDGREEAERKFQNKQARFMVATQSAGARGRTWTAATLVVYYTNGYDLELREQSEDRAHRIGQTGTVTYVDLVSPNTIEDRIVKALRAKRNVVKTVLQDGLSVWI